MRTVHVGGINMMIAIYSQNLLIALLHDCVIVRPNTKPLITFGVHSSSNGILSIGPAHSTFHLRRRFYLVSRASDVGVPTCVVREGRPCD